MFTTTTTTTTVTTRAYYYFYRLHGVHDGAKKQKLVSVRHKDAMPRSTIVGICTVDFALHYIASHPISSESFHLK